MVTEAKTAQNDNKNSILRKGEKMNTKRTIWLAAAILAVVGLNANASLTFEVFTTNGQYAGSSDLDLSMEVSNGFEKVSFTFFNNSLIDSSVRSIFVQDGTLFGIDVILSSHPDVNYSESTSGTLPGGELLTPPFVPTHEFGVSADPPPTHKGINPGQWVKVTYDLLPGKDISDVINALGNGDLRIGIHIIGLPDGSSESAILIPEPATMLILGLGSVLLRKRK